MNKNLLLLSSSRVNDTGYLSHALPHIQLFLSQSNANKKKLLFVPYAGISVSFDQYESAVQAAFETINLEIESIHQINDKLSAIQSCSGIVVGGGNTFSLLNSLYQEQLLEPIRNAVLSKDIPYIGWSAGSNIAAPTIRTTNDMPIVEPPSFAALHLLPWQINPHYIDGNPPGHNGETRQQRLEEFLVCNPNQKVIAIPEGAALKYQNDQISYLGDRDGYLFTQNDKTTFDSSTNLNHLLAQNAATK